MEYKVSVIVPVYNVEKYIEICLNSIINQSYTNLEIIVINDGSTDNSGQICNLYAEKDKRIKIINQTNAGLSEARNTGMYNMTGDFVLFLDSDDWLDNKMINEMMEVIRKYKVDVVQSAFYYAYDKHMLFDNRYYEEFDDIVILNNDELMKELVINEKVKNFAWGKLYKASLIKNKFFAKGKLFEDVFWAHNIMADVKKYAIVNSPMCFYRQREGSIVSKYSVRNLDILEGLKERHEFIIKNYSHLEQESYKLILKTSLLQYHLIQKNSKQDKDKFHRKNIKNYINKNYYELQNAIKNDKNLYIELKLFMHNYQLYNIYRILVKILKRLGVIKKEKKLKKVSYNDVQNI